MDDLAPFERRFFDADRRQSRIGDGVSGGKAEGLLLARQVLDEHRQPLAAYGLDVERPFARGLGDGGLRALPRPQ